MNSPPSSQIEAEQETKRAAGRKGRERRCIASGEATPEANLVRFACAPDGQIVADVAAKLPGRGVWVRADRASVELAVKKGGFARGFKAQVRASAGLADDVEAALARRVLNLIGLARRAGALAIGATQVEGAIRSAALKLLIEASDGAEEGREKLMALHIGLWAGAPPAIGCFSSSELGVALGRERVIHACLLQERLASSLVVEISRLAGFRAIAPSAWPDSWRSMSWEPRLGQ
jgi:hypothetical protein